MSHEISEISEYYRVYNENNVKARKAHKCNAQVQRLRRDDPGWTFVVLDQSAE